MYKVFINEKNISINNSANNSEKNILYQDFSTIDIAMDLLENTSCKEVNLYAEDAEKIWDDFCDYFPIIEAAGGIVKNANGEVLFIHRLGKWDLPKGKLEPNETIDNAAVREVQEETGLKSLNLNEFIDTTYHIYREKTNNAPILKTTYWYSMEYYGNEILTPQLEEGISKVEWKNKENILNQVLPNTFRNIQLILEKAKSI